ncbi:hypothetical protein KP509_38G036200 [Ceratopteris richardii]|nr:hypothetical protein KP509_38G036200 [Ceratopteris richardii]
MTARFEEDTSDKESVAGSEEIKGTDAENQLLHSYSPLSGMNQVMTEGMLSTFTDVKRNLPLTSSMTSSSNYDDKVSNIVPDQGAHMRRLLSWRRRRKYRVVQECREPLLRKAQNGTGGDDIDRDRNLSFMYPLSQGSNHALFSSEDISEFLSDGDVQFSIGYWERKELVNRIGHTKLLTEVFFASIDQRSERAGGESACTALVVVIADWLHRNPDRMPIRAEFDTLIRQGSAEWRKLCDNEFHRKEFPDYHFDLETVLQAKIRPLGIVKGGTYVGFFKPEMENHMFDVLQGAALFDDVWEASIVEGSALLKTLETVEPAIYIVSWNDHFFVLKVDRESYSIIDTLGERLYEGCKQAYMLRFNKETVLTHQIDSDKQFDGKKDNQCSLLPLYSSPKCCFSSHISNTSSTQEPQKTPDSSHSHPHLQDERVQVDGSPIQDADNFEISYSGRDACKEFIKSFYAAIALKQLYKDIQNRRLGTNPVHRRLQIEFHHTCRLSNLESEQEISSIVQNT